MHSRVPTRGEAEPQVPITMAPVPDSATLAPILTRSRWMPSRMSHLPMMQSLVSARMGPPTAALPRTAERRPRSRTGRSLHRQSQSAASPPILATRTSRFRRQQRRKLGHARRPDGGPARPLYASISALWVAPERHRTAAIQQPVRQRRRCADPTTPAHLLCSVSHAQRQINVQADTASEPAPARGAYAAKALVLARATAARAMAKVRASINPPGRPAAQSLGQIRRMATTSRFSVMESETAMVPSSSARAQPRVT